MAQRTGMRGTLGIMQSSTLLMWSSRACYCVPSHLRREERCFSESEPIDLIVSQTPTRIQDASMHSGTRRSVLYDLPQTVAEQPQC